MPKTSSRNARTQQRLATGGGDAAGQAVLPSSDAAALQQTMQGESADPAAREERVRYAAYEAYLRRNGAPGDELQDWLDAEAQIDGKN